MEENYCLVLKTLRKILSEREKEDPMLVKTFYEKMKICSDDIMKIFGPKTEKILTGKVRKQ